MDEKDNKNYNYETQRVLLQTIITEYCDSIKAFSKHGILGWLAATYLLNEIIKNCENIKNEQAKSFVLRTQLKRFIANGESHCLLPNSSTDQYGLRGRIVTKFFSKGIYEINPLVNRLKQKQETKKAILKNKRVELEIPREGVPYNFAHKVAEATYKINLIPNLYSHFKLKVKDGVPHDVFGKELPDGIYQFVILTNNEFRFLPTKFSEENTDHYEPFLKYRAHHQIAGGQNVYSAGNFEVQDGKITWIDGGSGHYGTEKMKFVDYAVFLLESLGIDTTNIQKKEREPLDCSEIFYRVLKNIKWFAQGIWNLGQNGEVIQNRPSTEEVWENKVPKF